MADADMAAEDPSVAEPPPASDALSLEAPERAAPYPSRPRRSFMLRLRKLFVLALPAFNLVLLAPIAIAGAIVVLTCVTDVAAVLIIVRLVLKGQALQAEPAFGAIAEASRLGFLALGYLGLFAALMALATGLLGRGRGRLFIVPGAILTGTALVLFLTSVLVASPLLTLAHLTHRMLAALAIYVAVDAVALGTLLADARETRRGIRSKRRRPGRPSAAPSVKNPPFSA